MEKAINFNDVDIVYVKGSAYRIHFLYMRKDDAIIIMSNSNFMNKKGVLQICFTIYKKWVKQLTIKEREKWY